ncbi:hypothetical protein PAAG_11486 [Paracoccidioides lutzii Pb01]|uniref:Uncharacterized protein n=1 Tax=Paracoccidioides lutzii (strain ATCC MYA-826 / Pb01) TaxID=502779 RepID=A0A0A2V6N7_PARBA|nr:hypothetical protein PAAG_11486 [Paracoccidioides lutzii Pb01]KGQ01765.1 hypothetical protein PAAG_11486 [Paracoccidioides lutzii Pb01]
MDLTVGKMRRGVLSRGSLAVVTTEGGTMCDKRTEWKGVAENKMTMRMVREPEDKATDDRRQTTGDRRQTRDERRDAWAEERALESSRETGEEGMGPGGRGGGGKERDFVWGRGGGGGPLMEEKEGKVFYIKTWKE